MITPLSKRASFSRFAVPCYYQGGHRVTQHFMDAVGRETNTVVTAVVVPGSATVADCATTGPHTSEMTAYPDGTSDYGVRTDMRGVRTVSWGKSYADREEHVTRTFSPTNHVNPVILSRNTYYRNGASKSYREWDGGWTRDTRLTEHDASGFRIDTQVTEASDHPVVTNSVTMSDVLGRTAATVTPLGVSSNLYDGATMRVLTTTRTRQPPVQNLYDDLGEQVGRFRVCGGILC